MTNLAIQTYDNLLIDWDYFVNEISRIFYLSDREAITLYNSNTAKIIATIPFAANCEEPERTAIAHLCLFESEIKGFQKYCSHKPSDDANIFNRLAFISTFFGGNPQIIDHGMNMLAFIMLQHYKASAIKDKKMNIYNPIVNGVWDYKSLRTQLLAKIHEISCPELDIYFTTIKAEWK